MALFHFSKLNVSLHILPEFHLLQADFNHASSDRPQSQQEVVPMDTTTTFKLLRIELGNLHDNGNSPGRHPGDPQPRRVDGRDDIWDCKKWQNTQKGKEQSDTLTRNDVGRVDVHLAVIDAILVAVCGIEVHTPEEDKETDWDAMLDDVTKGLLAAGDRSPPRDGGVTNSKTQDILGVNENLAEDGSLQVGVKHDAGGQWQHEAPAERKTV